MIRIRFFGPRELIKRHFSAKQYRGLTVSQSRLADILLLSQDAVRPWMCAQLPPLQRQLAERLRRGTVDGRPHPAVTRTHQYAAGICPSRDGQRQSAKSFHRRWKHEIQIALLQRRAAMARAALPNPSARAQWVFVGITDRAMHHGGVMSQPLTGRLGCTTFTSTAPLRQHYQITMTSSSFLV